MLIWTSSEFFIMYQEYVSNISKTEREMSDLLKKSSTEIQSSSCATDHENMNKVMQSHFKYHEVSAQEAVAHTCSMKLKSINLLGFEQHNKVQEASDSFH